LSKPFQRQSRSLCFPPLYQKNDLSYPDHQWRTRRLQWSADLYNICNIPCQHRIPGSLNVRFKLARFWCRVISEVLPSGARRALFSYLRLRWQPSRVRTTDMSSETLVTRNEDRFVEWRADHNIGVSTKVGATALTRIPKGP
jgi:hypothetical protein